MAAQPFVPTKQMVPPGRSIVLLMVVKSEEPRSEAVDQFGAEQ
jgi:hypothetical protein